MIVVFGVARHEQPLGMELGACPHCGASGYRDQLRRYGVFHLFFVPMFTVRETIIASCSACGRDEVVRPRPDIARAPRLHRYGFVVPVVIVLGVATAAVMARRARERDVARVESARAAGEKRLDERLRSKEQHANVGSVDGGGPIAARIAKTVAPLLREKMALSEASLGVYAVQVATPVGENLLLLTRVADSAEVDAAQLPSIARALADEIAAQSKEGTQVTWSILHRGVYVASLGGRLGGTWFAQYDPRLARALAEEALNYEGLIH